MEHIRALEPSDRVVDPISIETDNSGAARIASQGFDELLYLADPERQQVGAKKVTKMDKKEFDKSLKAANAYIKKNHSGFAKI